MEPIGAHRSDWQAASICAAVMNAMAVQNHSRRRFRVKDFLLEFADGEKDVPTEGAANWQKMKFTAQMFVAISNAESTRKKRRS